jgi:hypothetical protein
MKSMARLAAAALVLERETGRNQCEIRVMPIVPSCMRCINSRSISKFFFLEYAGELRIKHF